MKYEDNDKPLYFLQKALSKLITYGFDTFDLYCDEVGLSYCDRNSVIGKARIAHGKTQYREIPCPKELRGERWDFYTKTCGYSNEKAKRILDEIDKLHKAGHQFDPDVNGLINSML